MKRIYELSNSISNADNENNNNNTSSENQTNELEPLELQKNPLGERIEAEETEVLVVLEAYIL